jgi:hypothetical protein
MKKMLLILTFALAAGCVPSDEKDLPATCDAACEANNQNNVTPADSPDIKGSFISGHLGNYWDCPQDGYSAPTDASSADAGMGADVAPCEVGNDNCGGGPLNCEGAQLTIRLTNGGQADATSVEVSKIEIFDADGLSLAVLPVIGLLDATTNESFDGTLAVGQSIDLRVDYRGPTNLYALLPTDETGSRVGGTESALIEITVSAENHDDVIIDGGELFVLPAVVT